MVDSVSRFAYGLYFYYEIGKVNAHVRPTRRQNKEKTLAKKKKLGFGCLVSLEMFWHDNTAEVDVFNEFQITRVKAEKLNQNEIHKKIKLYGNANRCMIAAFSWCEVEDHASAYIY